MDKYKLFITKACHLICVPNMSIIHVESINKQKRNQITEPHFPNKAIMKSISTIIAFLCINFIYSSNLTSAQGAQQSLPWNPTQRFGKQNELNKYIAQFTLPMIFLANYPDPRPPRRPRPTGKPRGWCTMGQDCIPSRALYPDRPPRFVESPPFYDYSSNGMPWPYRSGQF